MYTNLQTLRGYIFHVLQHFATKLNNSTHFRMLVLTVVKDFVRLAWIESLSNTQIVIKYAIILFEQRDKYHAVTVVN